MKNAVVLSALVFASASPSLYAKGLGQQSLEEITVTAAKLNSSLTSPSLGEARDLLEQIPGEIHPRSVKTASLFVAQA